MKKVLYIISGANGSGKTTFGKNLQLQLGFKFINADEIAKELDPDNSTGGKLTAGREFFKQIDDEIEHKHSFIIESTLSGKYLKRLVLEVADKGYSVELIYIFLESPLVCIERIKERILHGRHFVPDNDVIRRFYRSKNNFWNVYRHLSDKWLLIYNSELSFKEFCIGSRDKYLLNDAELFSKFQKDISDGHE
ncbi:MAG: zeta toxin family protein [Lentisphaeria bacterium]|nr:zeta toxin family protein [Lentisphaeria bacterium]NQZ66807.1 zeta toxin family protein [Lentisphaeria bacterium]